MECFFFFVLRCEWLQGCAPRKEESGKGTHSNLTKSEQSKAEGASSFRF